MFRIIRRTLAVCLLSATAAHAQTPITMKLATPTLNDGQNEFLNRLAAAVEKDSNGRIKAEVYPAGQLGPVPREIEEVQLGAIQGFITPAEYLDSVDPRFQVLNAPGLFESMDHVDRATKDSEFRKMFFTLGGKRGVKVGAVFVSGPEAFDSRAPIRTLSDLKGLKIRVLASPLQMKSVDALGATPVPISLGDVLPALQQGTIDGVLSVLPVLAAFRYYTVAKYFTQSDFAYGVSTFIISKLWFDKLPADLQKIVATDALKVGDQMQPWVVGFYKKEAKAWVHGGGQLIKLPPKQRQQAMQELQKVADKVVDANPGLKKMYKVTKAAAQRTR